jgi:ribosomal protein S18 acetylase RimI-like enzyme
MKTIFFFLLCFALPCYGFKDFKQGEIEYLWDRTDKYEEGLQVYLQAFRKLYTELNVEGREEHFAGVMKEELKLAKENPKNIHWLIAYKDGKPIGLGIYEMFAYPDLYIREMAVMPEYQRMGIGKVLAFAPLKDLPDLRKILIVTRRINKPAISFYEAIGFAHSDFCHATYNPERYLGMEWVNSAPR